MCSLCQTTVCLPAQQHLGILQVLLDPIHLPNRLRLLSSPYVLSSWLFYMRP